MLKILTALIPFIRELFFDKKEEMDFKNPSFNAKKWLQFVLFVLLFTLVLFVGGRLVSITNSYMHLQAKFKQDEIMIKDSTSELQKLKEANKLLLSEKEFLDKHCYKAPSNPNTKPDKWGRNH